MIAANATKTLNRLIQKFQGDNASVSYFVHLGSPLMKNIQAVLHRSCVLRQLLQA
jgi:hypothetical protein